MCTHDMTWNRCCCSTFLLQSRCCKYIDIRCTNLKNLKTGERVSVQRRLSTELEIWRCELVLYVCVCDFQRCTIYARVRTCWLIRVEMDTLSLTSHRSITSLAVEICLVEINITIALHSLASLLLVPVTLYSSRLALELIVEIRSIKVACISVKNGISVSLRSDAISLSVRKRPHIVRFFKS